MAMATTCNADCQLGSVYVVQDDWDMRGAEICVRPVFMVASRTERACALGTVCEGILRRIVLAMTSLVAAEDAICRTCCMALTKSQHCSEPL